MQQQILVAFPFVDAGAVRVADSNEFWELRISIGKPLNGARADVELRGHPLFSDKFYAGVMLNVLFGRHGVLAPCIELSDDNLRSENWHEFNS